MNIFFAASVLLQKAIINQDETVFPYLLDRVIEKSDGERSIGLDNKDEDGDTALMGAIISKKQNIFLDLLINKKANAKVKNKKVKK